MHLYLDNIDHTPLLQVFSAYNSTNVYTVHAWTKGANQNSIEQIPLSTQICVIKLKNKQNILYSILTHSDLHFGIFLCMQQWGDYIVFIFHHFFSLPSSLSFHIISSMQAAASSAVSWPQTERQSSTLVNTQFYIVKDTQILVILTQNVWHEWDVVFIWMWILIQIDDKH